MTLKKSGHGAAVAAGMTAIGVGGVTVAYAHSLFNKYKKNGGTKYTSFWQWMLAGMPSTDTGNGGGGGGGGSGYVVSPTLISTPTSVTVPGTFVLSGTGYTKGGIITITSNPSTGTTSYYADSNGNFSTGTQSINTSIPAGDSVQFVFTATDNTTQELARVSVTFTSPSGGGGGGGTITNLPIATSPTSLIHVGGTPMFVNVGGNGMAALAKVNVTLTENGVLLSTLSTTADMLGTWTFNNYEIPWTAGLTSVQFQAVQSDGTRISAIADVQITTSGGGSYIPVTVNGCTFYYYAGTLETLSWEGLTLVGEYPIYIAYGGWQGAGYYWFSGHNAITSVVLTLKSMFDVFNAAIQSINPLTP